MPSGKSTSKTKASSAGAQVACSSLSSNASFPASLNLEQRTRGANRVRYASTSNNRTRTHTSTRLTGQSFETYSISLSIWSLSPPQTSPVTSLLMADLNPPLTGPCYPGSGEMQIDSRSEVAFFEGLNILRTLSFQTRLEESQVNVSLHLPRWVFRTTIAAQTGVCLIWEASLVFSCCSVYHTWKSDITASDVWLTHTKPELI